MENIQNLIKRLREELVRHNALYYDKNESEISDGEYDALVRKLECLEQEYPLFALPKSPTKKVSGYVSSSFRSIKHAVPMLSLDNTYSRDETASWYEKTVKKLNNSNLEFVIEPKIDGVSANLMYLDGVLVVGATRGDGKTGEDVTENIKTIQDIPHKLKIESPPSFFELRGEVYINKSDFKKFNEKIFYSTGKKFANSRNAASGSLRQKNFQITAERKLRFFIHSFGKIEKGHFEKQSEFLKYCQSCGFKLQSNFKICNSFEEMSKFMDIMLEKKFLLNYEIDGLVIKVNNLRLQSELGSTNKSPKWAVAFKFPSKQATTKLIKIRSQVGRTGIITPSAVLEPVPLSGVIISHATLHNFEEIERLNVNEGDIVLMERAGDVIPKIVKVMRKESKSFFKPPKKCPSCGSEAVKESEKKVAYRCINLECPAQFRRHLIHFVSRNAMDIDGFGESIVDQLLEKKKLYKLSDIYRLSYDDFMALKFFKNRKASNLIKAIAESKKRSLSRLIFALGIRHIGEKVSKIVAKRFKTMEALFSVSFEDFSKVQEVGEVLALSLREFFKNTTVRHVIEDMALNGVNMMEDETYKKGSQLEGRTFVLTGELERYSRQKASEIIKSLGGKVTSSVSKKTDYVLTGENAGSKLAKAKELDVNIIDETGFEKLINIMR
ncbi:MAG: NAD-dependent DNA ligase LigA [Endomicrobium sp.]|jgi:DNA ligase (NAD+)|nr:NAD-dependent DNA ligase LigA [Endomicrobium sp.]